MGGELMQNADGSRSVRFADGRVEQVPADGERGLGVSSIFPRLEISSAVVFEADLFAHRVLLCSNYLEEAKNRIKAVD